MKNKILVIGGTGKTGRKVVEKLENRGHSVRIGSRNGTPPFDWNATETWAAALEGMDAVYITYQPDLAVPGALGAIEALCRLAREQQVGKLVLLSGKGEREAELCEQAVIHSGLRYTIVRASWFSQNFSESFLLEPILAGHVALPQADAPIPFVDTDDIADVAVEVLLSNSHDGQIYQLTGTRTLTFPEAVATIAKASGRNIRFTPVSLSAYAGMLSEAGLPADYVWLIHYLFAEVLGNPGNQEVTRDIERVLCRQPKDFGEYVRETANTGIWTPRVAETV